MKKKIVNISVWTVLVILTGFILSKIANEYNSTKCSKLQIILTNSGDDYFISEQDIRKYIYQLGDSLEGQSMKNINIEILERYIEMQPYIADAEIFTTFDGVLNIKVSQRKPIVHVQNAYNESFYIAEDGVLLLPSKSKSIRVIYANGFITDIHNGKEPYTVFADTNINKNDSLKFSNPLYKIYLLAKYITENEFLKAQISQIFLNNNGDFELIPVVGEHLIVFGDISNIQTKFEDLIIFYKNGLSLEGWYKFDTINLKYNGQIVCTTKKN